MYKVTRRRFIQGTTGLLAMHAVPVAATLRSPTPRQSAGPFYPEELPLDDDNDLTHVAGVVYPGEVVDYEHGRCDPHRLLYSRMVIIHRGGTGAAIPRAGGPE